jgi:hypothetical protein
MSSLTPLFELAAACPYSNVGRLVRPSKLLALSRDPTGSARRWHSRCLVGEDAEAVRFENSSFGFDAFGGAVMSAPEPALRGISACSLNLG